MQLNLKLFSLAMATMLTALAAAQSPPNRSDPLSRNRDRQDSRSTRQSDRSAPSRSTPDRTSPARDRSVDRGTPTRDFTSRNDARRQPSSSDSPSYSNARRSDVGSNDRSRNQDRGQNSDRYQSLRSDSPSRTYDRTTRSDIRRSDTNPVQDRFQNSERYQTPRRDTTSRANVSWTRSNQSAYAHFDDPLSRRPSAPSQPQDRTPSRSQDQTRNQDRTQGDPPSNRGSDSVQSNDRRSSAADRQTHDPLSRNRNSGSSRSGNVRYGTVNNYAGRVRNTVTVIRIPGMIDNHLNQRVFRSEQVGVVVDGYRRGYVQYNRNWRDDDFCYPFYVFDPFRSSRCVASPFYFYLSSPAYISYERVTFDDYDRYEDFRGHSYDWNNSDRGNDDYGYSRPLDSSIDDLRAAYENGDTSLLDRLVPKRGLVRIYTDHQYRYTLDARDLYDVLQDGITTTHTDRYEILSVRWNDRDQARVVARHDFRDNRDEQRTIYHTYTLVRERGNYVIREFGSSYDRP